MMLYKKKYVIPKKISLTPFKRFYAFNSPHYSLPALAPRLPYAYLEALIPGLPPSVDVTYKQWPLPLDQSFTVSRMETTQSTWSARESDILINLRLHRSLSGDFTVSLSFIVN